MNPAWIAVALVGAFAAFSWAENQSKSAASQNTTASDLTGTSNLLNSLAKLLQGAAPKPSAGGGSGSSGGGSGSGGGFGAPGSLSASSGSPDNTDPFNSDPTVAAMYGFDATTGQQISFDTQPSDSSTLGLIQPDAGPGDFQIAPVDYTPPTDTSSSVDDGTGGYGDSYDSGFDNGGSYGYDSTGALDSSDF